LIFGRRRKPKTAPSVAPGSGISSTDVTIEAVRNGFTVLNHVTPKGSLMVWWPAVDITGVEALISRLASRLDVGPVQMQHAETPPPTKPKAKDGGAGYA